MDEKQLLAGLVVAGVMIHQSVVWEQWNLAPAFLQVFSKNTSCK
jgi:hypothetical protein